ncbi:kanadaptin-like [Arapaima gigas]
MADVLCSGETAGEVEEKMEVSGETDTEESEQDKRVVEAKVATESVPGESDPFKKPTFVLPSSLSKKAAPAEAVVSTARAGEEPRSGNEEKAVAAQKRENGARPKAQLPAKPPPSACPPLPYEEPPWAGAPPTPYSFEVLKNGAIVDTVPLGGRSFSVVGRLPVCDVALEHPSVSRYHAVVQYRARPLEHAGLYAFDLGSTHGTFINKSRIPPKTYVRVHVGHVLRFGGSTRLFVLQGPESDEEAESELTVTELKERARKHREALERRMVGEGSDDDEDEKEEDGGGRTESGGTKSSAEDAGCSWGMAEEALPEEDESEENPFATEFQEDQEAAYLKDPKKALQGFYDREGEELEFEYEDKGHGTWTCRVRLPVDDAHGRQLVAEVTHSGKKKEAAIQCSLEACRILEARGLLRQEAVSRKRKKKNWEEEDFYDSDDDTFLDRTGVVERKRKERMKKAGKIEEQPETHDSLVGKLAEVEKELSETEKKLSSSAKGNEQSSTEDPLDAFMSAVRSQGPLDSVARRKLHVRMAELRKESQRLHKLVELTRPAMLPPLQAAAGSQSTDSTKAKKPSLPLFGAMKGGSKFKLKTGTIGNLPPKRPSLPLELFNTKELPPGGEEEDEEEEEEKELGVLEKTQRLTEEQSAAAQRAESQPHTATGWKRHTLPCSGMGMGLRTESPSLSTGRKTERKLNQSSPQQKAKKKAYGPSRPPATLSAQYPEDDPDYCIWMPPTGQSGDGRTHLNEKYGY